MKRTGIFTTLPCLGLLIANCSGPAAENNDRSMENKQTVRKYMQAFNALDHDRILSCLTDDVIWELPGVYRYEGKIAFDKEIENDAFTGKPVIVLNRLTEEHDVVIAEGTVVARKSDGTLLNLVFCDVFEMENGLIKKLTSYLMTKP